MNWHADLGILHKIMIIFFHHARVITDHSMIAVSLHVFSLIFFFFGIGLERSDDLPDSPRLLDTPMGTCLCNFVLIFGLWKFHDGISIIEMCNQLNLTANGRPERDNDTIRDAILTCARKPTWVSCDKRDRRRTTKLSIHATVDRCSRPISVTAKPYSLFNWNPKVLLKKRGS